MASRLLIWLCLFILGGAFNFSFYHNDRQIQSVISELTQNPAFHRNSCFHSPIYKKIETRHQSANLTAIITCNVHAREIFAGEVCLQFLQILSNHSVSISQYLIQRINFTIFYSANEMRESIFDGNYCRRTNKNKVDLNRNFPTGFSGEEFGSEVNSGPEPLSEDFSKCLESAVEELQPDIFLDIHTGQFSIYYAGDMSDAEFGILSEIRARICPNCMFRNDKDPNGVIFADLKIRRSIKWANLFEVYGGFDQQLPPTHNCFFIFNPTTKISYDYYRSRGAMMMLEYFREIAQKQAGQPSNQFDSDSYSYKCLNDPHSGSKSK